MLLKVQNSQSERSIFSLSRPRAESDLFLQNSKTIPRWESSEDCIIQEKSRQFGAAGKKSCPHCLKSYFFQLVVSKCSIIFHWHVCDKLQRNLWLNMDFFLCDLSKTFLLLFWCMPKRSVVNWGIGRLLGSPVDRAVVMEQGVAGSKPARFNFSNHGWCRFKFFQFPLPKYQKLSAMNAWNSL